MISYRHYYVVITIHYYEIMAAGLKGLKGFEWYFGLGGIVGIGAVFFYHHFLLWRRSLGSFRRGETSQGADFVEIAFQDYAT